MSWSMWLNPAQRPEIAEHLPRTGRKIETRHWFQKARHVCCDHVWCCLWQLHGIYDPCHDHGRSVWYGADSGLSEFSTLFLLGALGAATTDACSAVWALLIAIFKGKLGDVFRSAASKPGAILIGAAVIGGPLCQHLLCAWPAALAQSLCPSARCAQPSAQF